ncbi:MAG: tyrosinase [Sphingomonadales bacterium]|nr:tyrosinase [Sphingomonadales bacterium]
MASSPPRVRKDVYKLASTDKTLEWYGKAINVLKNRPIKDPTSWRYQAAIHGYNRSEDPLKKSSDVLPSSSEQAKFWNQCQHGSWYFLSWHRGYLLWFERTCLAAIVKLGGPKDWALPYWNYSSKATGTVDPRLIPPAFRQPTVGVSPNPLFTPGHQGGTSGNAGITSFDVSLECLKRTKFVGASTGGSPGFGGIQTGFHHDPGTLGACEATPHNNIHSAVGGFMWSFNTAGLDPLFWLHHCNIDRLWEVWRARSTSTGDPTESAWKDFLFNIHNETGAAITFKSSAMSSTIANGYKYQGISDPFAATAGSILASVEETPVADTGPRPPAELAGATDGSISLGQGRSSARVAIAPHAQSILASVGDDSPKRVFLNIENITGKGPPGTYKVFVNVPEGENPDDYGDHFVGTLALFGISEQSSGDAAHGGSGLTFVLEITDLVQKLQDEGRWNESDLDVDFVPLRPVPDGMDVKVGRVSVYHA